MAAFHLILRQVVDISNQCFHLRTIQRRGPSSFACSEALLKTIFKRDHMPRALIEPWEQACQIDYGSCMAAVPLPRWQSLKASLLPTCFDAYLGVSSKINLPWMARAVSSPECEACFAVSASVPAWTLCWAHPATKRQNKPAARLRAIPADDRVLVMREGRLTFTSRLLG